MNRDLRELLYGRGTVAPASARFFVTASCGRADGHAVVVRGPAGNVAAYYAGWITRPAIVTEQQQAAAWKARERFGLPVEIAGIESYSNRPVHVGVPDNDPILRLLADVIVYEAVSDTLEASDYLAVHRLLTRGMTFKPSAGASRRFRPALPVCYDRNAGWETPGKLEAHTAVIREPQQPGLCGGQGRAIAGCETGNICASPS